MRGRYISMQLGVPCMLQGPTAAASPGGQACMLRRRTYSYLLGVVLWELVTSEVPALCRVKHVRCGFPRLWWWRLLVRRMPVRVDPTSLLRFTEGSPGKGCSTFAHDEGATLKCVLYCSTVHVRP